MSKGGEKTRRTAFAVIVNDCPVLYSYGQSFDQPLAPHEHWHIAISCINIKILKGECIRVKNPLSLEDARRLVAEFVAHYNTVRLHSAIGYVTPADKPAGRAAQIWAERRRKLAVAQARRSARQGLGLRSAEPGIAPRPGPGVDSEDLGGG
jgi:transposase InsO family protein